MIVCGAALALSACSAEVSVGGSSADTEAEELIEGELAEESGLGPLTAACEDATDVEAGDSFECTGTTEDGRVVEFTADVTEDGAGEVNSTNLIVPTAIAGVAEEAARVLAQQNDIELAPDAVTCDDSEGVIVERGATLDCEVADPQTGEPVDAMITFTDPETGAFEVDVTG